jgi:hypothetical protein
MSFDFDGIRKRLISSRTIFNVDGIYQTGRILECLEICPFMDIVAEVLEIPHVAIYDRLRYYLTEDEFHLLLEILKARRKFEIFSFKKRLGHSLKSKMKT